MEKTEGRLFMAAPVLPLSSQQKASLDAGFSEAFGILPQRDFSAPGQTETGGNHTDHQRGRVLAALKRSRSPWKQKSWDNQTHRPACCGWTMVLVESDF